MNLAWWLVPAFGEKWDEEPKSKAANRLDFRCFVPSQEMKRNRRTLLPVAAWFDLDAFLSMPRYTTEYTASSVVHRPGTGFELCCYNPKWTERTSLCAGCVWSAPNKTQAHTHTQMARCVILSRVFLAASANDVTWCPESKIVTGQCLQKRLTSEQSAKFSCVYPHVLLLSK